jgi:hypothetical protein
MLVSEPQKFGEVTPLVTAATALLSAGWALVFGVFGRKKFFPNGDPNRALVTRIAVLVTALGVAYVFYTLSDPDQARQLSRLLPPAAGVIVVLLLVYIYFHSILVHDRWLNQPNDPNAEKIIGGFPKARQPIQVVPPAEPRVVTPAEQIWGSNRDPDLVWPIEARARARTLLTGCYVLLMISGTVAATYAGAAVIAARSPRIEEFSIAPGTLNRGDVAVVRWRVVNADSIELQPNGSIAAMGSMPVRPDKDTTYTLRAKNSVAERGIAQGVIVNTIPAAASAGNTVPPARKPKRAPTPGNAEVVEARDCKLVQNVVIRGEGWLQSENPGVGEAECAVRLPRAGRYEIFVDYASPESRPVRVALNRKIIAENGLAAPTGGLEDANRLDQSLGVQTVPAGANTLQFHSEHSFPFIRRVRFQPL